ncbi:HD domain-containing phosphohydrolase [Geobacter sp. AOG1]|uniref:HD domain-containing phosphohydrolase n=1 Tax=Geobacter sp. AOG1 TaxID=1566346 RepID=UPI001CC7FB59|nr:HD domain-containing phosphohydrolase [Geobacter sp. AOG1]GFE59040.1 HDIG domain-containing protein [Geobacter sp. AOG1]
MKSLKVKILGLITIIVVTILVIAALLNFRQNKELIRNLADHNTTVIIETVKSSVINAMRSGHSDEVRELFKKIRSSNFISDLRIVSESGVIINSADEAEIGQMLPASDLKLVRKGAFPLKEYNPEKQVYDSYTRIMNTPECYGCHPSTQSVLGIMEIELSLANLDALVAKERKTVTTSTFIIICLIIITISLFLIHYVDRPIQQLIASMQKVEGGDFDCSTNISSSKEMSLLSDKFNRMVERLKGMVESAISHERELARAQEKLAHHREIHTMNHRLEDQLKEIENLNVSLEERIEEIEEANYKIADLAGELEDKNTNLEKAVSKLSTLYKVGLAINSTMESKPLFDLVVRTTMDTLEAQIGYIMLHDRQRNVLKVTTLLGHDSFAPEKGELEMKPSSVSAWVINNGKPRLITDIQETPEFDRMSAMGYERKTLICAPLKTKDETIGTITVVNKIDNSVYNNEDLELLTTIAAQASIAIKNVQLYEEQQKTYMNTIHALVSAIEASDSYTRGHSERVTRYCMELAKKLDMPPERLKIIERAAVLHDIGKIGIDLSLLHKEGRLTPEDIRELQQHPVIGMKILEPIEFLSDVRLCIGQHHERFDGKGYPNNVAADHLLLESRMLAIADSFDAMTSDRPYRKALSLDVAIKELVDNAGTQFDPDLVQPFVEVLQSGKFSFAAISVNDGTQEYGQPRVPICISAA